MAETLFITVMILTIFAIAIVGLAARDARQHRLREEKRPIGERIADIRKDAAFMVKELNGLLHRYGTEQPEAVEWIPKILDLYRQLEALASCPNASADECLVLAKAASQYAREKRIKGVFVSEQARRLAVLVSKRDAA